MTSRRRAPSTPSCVSSSMRISCSGSTTSSAKNRRWTSCSCGSPTPCSSRCGTATTSPCVQITMAEDFGVEDRGHFYDPVGALRDVVQNHLLQLLALIASEPPQPPMRTRSRDRRVDVFRAIPDADPAHYVRGQYDGYRGCRRAAALAHRDLRRVAAGGRQLALVRCVRSSFVPESRSPCGPRRSGSSSSARPGWRSCSGGRIPTSGSCGSIPTRVPTSGAGKSSRASQRDSDGRPLVVLSERARRGTRTLRAAAQ